MVYGEGKSNVGLDRNNEPNISLAVGLNNLIDEVEEEGGVVERIVPRELLSRIDSILEKAQQSGISIKGSTLAELNGLQKAEKRMLSDWLSSHKSKEGSI